MPQDLDDIARGIIERLTGISQIRDRALGDCRQIVRWSANSVRASHRGDFAEATSELGEARNLASAVMEYTSAFPSVYWAGYTQDAMREYAEAAITNAIIRKQPIPDPAALGVEDAAYLNALAEAASELRGIRSIFSVATISTAPRTSGHHGRDLCAAGLDRFSRCDHRRTTAKHR